MNSFWQTLTLANLPAADWGKHSLMMRLIGLLDGWRSQTFLFQYIHEIAVLVISLMFAFAPLVSNNYTGLFALACGLLWVLMTLASPQHRGMQLTASHLLLTLYWFCAVLATALSPVKVAAATGLVKLTLYLSVFLLMERVMRSPKWRSVLITVYLLTALFVSVYGIRQIFFGAEALATWSDPTSSAGEQVRIYSYLNNPNLFAGYILPAIPLCFAAILNWKGWFPKALVGLMLLLHWVCLYGTGCRGAWIGLVVAFFAMGVMMLYWHLPKLPLSWQKSVFPLFFGSIAVVIALGLIASSSFRDRALSIFAGREDSSNNFRINVWHSVIEMIRDRPILGIGPGNSAFNKIYPLYQKPNYSALGAYSIYLELMVEVGLAGFIAFLWFLLTVFNRGCQTFHELRRIRNPSAFWLVSAIAAMLGLLIHGFVDTVWYRPEVATVWWLLVAVVFSFFIHPVASEEQPSL